MASRSRCQGWILVGGSGMRALDQRRGGPGEAMIGTGRGTEVRCVHDCPPAVGVVQLSEQDLAQHVDQAQALGLRQT